MTTYEDGWQPIETAPKPTDPRVLQGPHILLGNKYGVTAAVWWNGRWLATANGTVMQVMDYDGPEWPVVYNPTHWRPMPAPPT